MLHLNCTFAQAKKVTFKTPVVRNDKDYLSSKAQARYRRRRNKCHPHRKLDKPEQKRSTGNRGNCRRAPSRRTNAVGSAILGVEFYFAPPPKTTSTSNSKPPAKINNTNLTNEFNRSQRRNCRPSTNACRAHKKIPALIRCGKFLGMEKFSSMARLPPKSIDLCRFKVATVSGASSFSTRKQLRYCRGSETANFRKAPSRHLRCSERASH